MTHEWHRVLLAREQRPLSRYRLAAEAIREGLGATRKVCLAGGLQPHEIEPLIEVGTRLRCHHPHLLLVLSPAHDCSSGEIYARCRHAGLQVARHSDGAGCSAEDEVYLLDTTEELGLFYAASDAAFVGSTLVNDGHPDPTLPARAGLPMVAGPHRGRPYLDAQTRALAHRLERGGSLRRGSNVEQISAALHDLLVDGQLGRALGECARRIACRARGGEPEQDDAATLSSFCNQTFKKPSGQSLRIATAGWRTQTAVECSVGLGA
ncbi:3-deoxy-D-manno-octulosonic acid transferase [Halorhodospira abdelmalekii]|uniref:3-deoxy-D-manno-octulosonic acid transferase n=1 Tax=Halorhodospira abdelmalekii TaxID=421629 RepID=UPI001907C85C|nr:hypothetical protein [Halorhodospira abdelmalekii]